MSLRLPGGWGFLHLFLKFFFFLTLHSQPCHWPTSLRAGGFQRQNQEPDLLIQGLQAATGCPAKSPPTGSPVLLGTSLPVQLEGALA